MRFCKSGAMKRNYGVENQMHDNLLNVSKAFINFH